MYKRGFASDNNSGIHPEIIDAIDEANKFHAVGYGDDRWTNKAEKLLEKEFGDDIDIYFVFNGTGANILALKSVTHSFNSIICAETSHIQVDECGSPEKFTGCKLIPISTNNGKLSVKEVKKHLTGFGFEHHAQPGVISITQATELGTVYTEEEIKELAELAHSNGMYLHMDGARISNAAVALNKTFKQITRDAGVDILSFGGTKNGMMMGEVVIFFNSNLSEFSKYYRKQAAQLCSKMRFISAQFIPYLENKLWKINASHANNMAKLLESEIQKIDGIEITQDVDANGVFAIIPRKIIPLLQSEYFFYEWDENRNEVRWMTSFDTTEEDVIDFTRLVAKLMGKIEN
jgi:threonine aldolase